MREYQELKEMIGVLEAAERREVINVLSIRDQMIDKSLSLNLFTSICKNPNLNFEQAHTILYTKPNLVAFKKLISRLSERIRDSLINRESLLNPEIYDDRARDVFLLERQLLMAEVLRYRGLFRPSNLIMEKVISKCKIYEHYDILIYAFEKKRRWKLPQLKEAELREIELEIEEYQFCKSSLRKVIEIYSRVIKIDTQNFSLKEILYVRNSIAEVEKLYRLSNSKHILYYLFYIKLQYYNLKCEYRKCVTTVNKLIEFLMLNNSVKTRLRIGNAILNRGVFLRKILEYEASILSIVESKKYLRNIPQNLIFVYEQLYLTYFYMGNLLKAKNYLTIILDDQALYRGFGEFKAIYYKAILEFCEGENQKSLITLKDLGRDERNLSLCLEAKILSILNYISLEMYDDADNYISNLKKYVRREKPNIKDIQKYENELKILGALSLKSYNFKSVMDSQKELISELEKIKMVSKESESNMFYFFDWLKAQYDGVKYDHSLVRKVLNKKKSIF